MANYQPTSSEIALAEQALAAAPELPLYGRVDMVTDHDGKPRVMELELIEPELWIRNHPESAQRMADCIASRLAR